MESRKVDIKLKRSEILDRLQSTVFSNQMDDVAFYDSQVQYQKRVGEIEKERLTLEREMFAMMKSDKKLQNLKAAKLRSYWQQVCEREKKARERNEEILKDFENMEVKLSELQSQTRKLRNMKKQYDEKVKQMYPKWRQEVEISRAKRQLQERGIIVSPRKENMDPVRIAPSRKEADGNIRPTRGKRTSPRHETTTDVHKKFPTDVQSTTSSHNQPEMVELPRQNAGRDSKPTSIMSQQPISTSSLVSVRSKTDLESQASIQPPPESFADETPQRVVYVNTTSPMKSSASNISHNVIHTIPTALSSNGGQSDISETSMFSEEPVDNGRSSRKIGNISHVGSGSQSKVSTSPSKSPGHKNNSGISIGVHSTSPQHFKNNLTSPKKQLNVENKRQDFQSPSKTESVTKSHPSGKFSPRKDQTVSPLSTLSSATKSPDLKATRQPSISSFGSDDLSPRQAAPLTENATYQALLKQHTGVQPSYINVSNIDEESDEDDLENLLSPHGPPTDEKRQEPVIQSGESDTDSFNSDEASPVYIPTAMSAGSANQSSERKKEIKLKVAKAPWETDSEGDDSIGDTSFSATGGSLWNNGDKKPEPLDPQDDFDFYD